MVTPSATRDAGTEEHVGLDRHVARRCFVSWLNHTVSGAIIVTPACHRGLAQRALEQPLDVGELRRELTPATSSASASTTATVPPAPSASRDGVGQVELALGVVVADLLSERREQRSRRGTP